MPLFWSIWCSCTYTDFQNNFCQYYFWIIKPSDTMSNYWFSYLQYLYYYKSTLSYVLNNKCIKRSALRLPEIVEQLWAKIRKLPFSHFLITVANWRAPTWWWFIREIVAQIYLTEPLRIRLKINLTAKLILELLNLLLLGCSVLFSLYLRQRYFINKKLT